MSVNGNMTKFIEFECWGGYSCIPNIFVNVVSIVIVLNGENLMFQFSFNAKNDDQTHH